MVSVMDGDWESYALERLREPSPNGRWGILCDAKYSFAWEAYENLDFDPFELDDLGLDWPASRLAEIESIEDLTPEELAQWRIGAAQLTISSGDTSVAWIVALERPGLGQRWALFVGHTGCAPEDEPGLAGIFDSHYPWKEKFLRSPSESLATASQKPR